jgi:sterol desaturase/sphingolipid hydroxylase (fatty acid hydroxylase superfamily)
MDVLTSVAIGTVEGLGFLAGSLAIFTVTAAIMFRISPQIQLATRARRAWDYAVPKWIYAQPGAKVDLGLMLIRTFLISPALGLFATLFAAVDLTQLLVGHFGRPSLAMHGGGLILFIQLLVGLLSSELAFYSFHRLTHKNRFFWTSHRLHHSAEEMTFLTGGRGHPLDDVGFFISGLLIAAPLKAIGMYFTGATMHPLLPTVLLAYGIFSAVEDKFNHSHVPSSFGWLNYIFLSGHMHQIHHSAELRHRDRNFGATMSLFDWLFGTLYIPQVGETPRLGLNEDQLGEKNPHRSVRAGLVEPLAYLKDQLRQRRIAENNRRSQINVR